MPDAIGPAGALQYKTTSFRSLRNKLYQQMAEKFGIDLNPGQYRMDYETKRYVELLKSMYPDDQVPDDQDQIWFVRDVLSGKCYWRKEQNLWDEPPVSEMEVIAWAAQDHPDIEISGD